MDTQAKPKTNYRLLAKTVGIFMLSSVLRAITVHSFISPNNFAPGGVTGVAMMMSFVFELSPGYFTFLLNLPLIIMSFFVIGRRFALRTTMMITLSSVLMIVLDAFPFFDQFKYQPSTDVVLAAVAAGVLGGTGIALILNTGGSTGGTDIIAVAIQKKMSATNIAWILFTLDGIVVLSSVFVYNNGIQPVMLSLVELFCSGKVVQAITQGVSSAVKFEVITTDPEGLSEVIMRKLGRGVTSIRCEGMYTHTEKFLLICIVRKRQIATFRRLVQGYSANTFAYITPTNEVLGVGFKRGS